MPHIPRGVFPPPPPSRQYFSSDQITISTQIGDVGKSFGGQFGHFSLSVNAIQLCLSVDSTDRLEMITRTQLKNQN